MAVGIGGEGVGVLMGRRYRVLGGSGGAGGLLLLSKSKRAGRGQWRGSADKSVEVEAVSAVFEMGHRRDLGERERPSTFSRTHRHARAHTVRPRLPKPMWCRLQAQGGSEKEGACGHARRAEQAVRNQAWPRGARSSASTRARDEGMVGGAAARQRGRFRTTWRSRCLNQMWSRFSREHANTCKPRPPVLSHSRRPLARLAVTKTMVRFSLPLAFCLFWSGR